ncbi:MAG TPA: hypothetical protein VMW68_07065 [Methyloceanibacter sp.]|nr:hypothetical protein [Methyloceanibacter sp.]
MRLGAWGWSLAVCTVLMWGGALLMPGSAFAVSLSDGLKNYYAEFEIVIECEAQERLSTEDADAAEAAIDKIEDYYLKRDSSINTESLQKRAVADKDEGFRIMARSGGGLRPFCRQSLRDLLNKAEEVETAASEQ